MVLTFAGYEIRDADTLIHLVIQPPDPGPGKATDVYIPLTDAEVTSITTGASFVALLKPKLQRKMLGTGISSKLDPFVGQSANT